MITPAARTLANRAQTPAITRSSNGRSNIFENQLTSALRNPVSAPNGRSSGIVSSSRTASGAATNPAASRQVSVTAPTTVAAQPAIVPVNLTGGPAAGAAASTSAASPCAGSPTSGNTTLDAANALSAALRAAGIDPGTLGIVAHDDQVTYPGGSYVNHLLTLKAGSHVENFMADLTLTNPNVAVTEIKHLLSMG